MTHSCVTWLIHTAHDLYVRDMTCSYQTWQTYTTYDSFIRDMTRSYQTCPVYSRQKSFLRDMAHWCRTWIIHTRHDSFIGDMTRAYKMQLIVQDMTQTSNTGWMVREEMNSTKFPYCDTLQRTATHCNTLQHTAAHCNTLHHSAAYLPGKWWERRWIARNSRNCRAQRIFIQFMNWCMYFIRTCMYIYI